MIDEQFHNSLVALGDLTSRKHKLRTRIYILVALVVFPAFIGAGMLLEIRLKLWILAAAAVCFAVAEAIARSRIPALAEKVAADHDITLEQLMEDSKHIDSAL